MEGTTITTQDIFRFEQTGFDSNGKILGHFVPTGLQPSFLEKFEVSGIKLPEASSPCRGERHRLRGRPVLSCDWRT